MNTWIFLILPALILFSSPAIDTTKIEVEKPERFEGKRFRTLSALLDGQVSTIELMEGGAHVAYVNRALRANLREEIRGYFQCYESVNTSKDVFKPSLHPTYRNEKKSLVANCLRCAITYETESHPSSP